MTDLEQRILAETERFLAALPGLMSTHAGKAVVFLNGNVEGVFPDTEQAYRFAVQMFGLDGGFVVAPVASAAPIPVTAGVMYGLRP